MINKTINTTNTCHHTQTDDTNTTKEKNFDSLLESVLKGLGNGAVIGCCVVGIPGAILGGLIGGIVGGMCSLIVKLLKNLKPLEILEPLAKCF